MAACPSCGAPFDAREVSGITVALCKACDGAWLGAGDLDRITGQEIEAELAELVSAPTECRYCSTPLGFAGTCVRCHKQPTIQCPAGHGVMEAALVDIAGDEVEIDRCPSCRGVWMDGHERKLLDAVPPSIGRRREKTEQLIAYRSTGGSRSNMDAIDRIEALQQQQALRTLAVMNALSGGGMSMYQVSGQSERGVMFLIVIALCGAAALIYFFVAPMLVF